MTLPSAHYPGSSSSHEQTRVARHIARAEDEARARRPRGLGVLQRAVRALLLGELASYRRAGRFPRNDVSREQTPLFVDRHGARCAMAHLLEISGERTLVEEIRTARNRARIAELADEPRLLAWLSAAGLSVFEAAAIQPEYCFEGPPMCVCEADAPLGSTEELSAVLTVIEGEYERQTSDGSTAFIRITRVHGAPSDLTVGETMSVHWHDYTPPQGVVLTLLVPLRTQLASAGAELEAIPLSDSEFQCHRATGGPLRLDKDRFIAALLSEDCPRTLRSYGREWKRQPCGADGCSTEAATAGDTLGSAMILLSLLATMGLRRLRGRRA